jgi:hypothetical protein
MTTAYEDYFWYVTSCSFIDMYLSFSGTCSLPENEVDAFFWNLVSLFHSRRLHIPEDRRTCSHRLLNPTHPVNLIPNFELRSFSSDISNVIFRPHTQLSANVGIYQHFSDGGLRFDCLFQRFISSGEYLITRKELLERGLFSHCCSLAAGWWTG